MISTIILVSGKSNSGKGEFSSELEKLLSDNKTLNIIRCSLSTYIRQIAKDDFYWNGIDTPESRKFMAEVYRLGTEIYPYHMARRVWERDIKPYLHEGLGKHNVIIVESFREKNNYDYFIQLKEKGFIEDIITIRITRPNHDVAGKELKNHVSESDLDNFIFDCYIENDKGISEFKDCIKDLYNNVFKGAYKC